jgi:RNA polymerase sigma-70 factor (ECF subfamily)
MLLLGTFVPSGDSYDQGLAGVRLDFDSIVDQFYAPLYRFAMSLSRTEHDAADLVQETFLTWAVKGHQLRETGKIKSWLFTTLHRAFLAGQRRGVRFRHFELEEVQDELPMVEFDLAVSLDGRQAAEMLAAVDPQYRAVLALFYLEDYSYPEIAVVLEIPLGTVKSRLARGLGQLKALAARSPKAIRRDGGLDE